MGETAGDVQIHPLTSDRWPDLVRLFGPEGADGGCWCTYWRFSEQEYGDNDDFSVWRTLTEEQHRKNRDALRSLVDANEPPGLLACADGEPVGWCSIAPLKSYARLQSPRHLGPVHDASLWSIVCFFIHPACRGHRIASALLDASARFASDRGATAVEGYPGPSASPDAGSAYSGTLSMYQAARFSEADRPVWPRIVMRKNLPANSEPAVRPA